MKLINKIPLYLLGLLAVLLAVSPMNEQPHLIQKILMLRDGSLKNIVDAFDLLLHGLPILLFVYLLYRKFIALISRRYRTHS